MKGIASIFCFIFLGFPINAYSAETAQKEDELKIVLKSLKNAIDSHQLKAGDRVRFLGLGGKIPYDKTYPCHILGFSQDWNTIFLEFGSKIDTPSSGWVIMNKSRYGLTPDDKVTLYDESNGLHNNKVGGFYLDGNIAFYYENYGLFVLCLTVSQYLEQEVLLTGHDKFNLNDVVYSEQESGHIVGFFRNGDVLLKGIQCKRIDSKKLKHMQKNTLIEEANEKHIFQESVSSEKENLPTLKNSNEKCLLF